MDLQHVLKALWRFRVVVVVGALLAVALATLSHMRVDFSGGTPKLAYRQPEQWQSTATIFLTSRGFPWGSVVDPGTVNGLVREEGAPVDAERLTYLADLYRELATSDSMYRLLAEQGPIEGGLVPEPVLSIDGKDQLPMLNLSAVAATPGQAAMLARRYLDAFREFLARRQARARIPIENRVVPEVVREPVGAVLVEPRKMTRPIFILLAGLITTCGIALVLENLRPRVRVLDESTQRGASLADLGRRSA